MLAAVKGIVKGNTVVIDDEDIRDYDGAEVIVTLLNYPQRKAKKAPVDWDSFVIPSERGQHVDENNPQYYDKVKNFFSNGYEADKKFVTSVITMEEYFVFPYRNKLYSFIDMFDRLVETTGMEIVEVNQEIAKKAAQIRADYKGFKAMDAIQLAVACLTKCDLFLTNDKQLRQFKEIKCITVDELE